MVESTDLVAQWGQIDPVTALDGCSDRFARHRLASHILGPYQAEPYRCSVIRTSKLNALLCASSIVPPMVSQPIRHASS